MHNVPVVAVLQRQQQLPRDPCYVLLAVARLPRQNVRELSPRAQLCSNDRLGFKITRFLMGTGFTMGHCHGSMSCYLLLTQLS